MPIYPLIKLVDDVYDYLFINQTLDDTDPLPLDHFVSTFSSAEVDAAAGTIIMEGSGGKFKITIERVL